MNRAVYIWGKEENNNILWIRDEGGSRSVTNDIPNILADLIKAGIEILKYKYLYRDSMDNWDGIDVKELEGRITFTFFSLGGEKDFEKAKEKLIAVSLERAKRVNDFEELMKYTLKNQN